MDLSEFVDSDMFLVPPPEFESKDPVGFTWWILLHVAPLFGFDAQGNYDAKNTQVYFYVYLPIVATFCCAVHSLNLI